jgi:hypothetical protein
MTREDFFSLPLPLQVRLLFDALDEESSRALLAQEKPKLPLPPKYDMAIYRQGGHTWASEHSLDGLVWWRNRYQTGAESGGQYAEQDKKRVVNIDKWIAWRELFPTECWSGKRNDDDVVAKPPTKKPALCLRRNGNGQQRKQEQQKPDNQDLDPENFNF